MNVFLIVILATLVSEWSIRTVARVCTLGALQPDLPIAFDGYCDAEKYSQSQAYTKANTRFGLLTSTIHTWVTIGFIVAGGFAWVDEVSRGFGFGAIVTGLVFVAILLLLSDLLSLPMSLYRIFVIEEAFGFNKMTLGTYALDKLKGLVIGALLGGLFLAAILYFFETAGSDAWLYAWGVATIFMIALPPVFTTFIAPLFNKFEPLEDGDLKRALDELATKTDFPLTGVFVMDGSRRSAHSNAYFSGFGKNKRIALFDTLIEKHSTEELVAVLAHEIGHYKKRHIFWGTVLGIFQVGLLLWILSFFISEPGLFEAFGVETVSTHGGLVFFTLLYSPISFCLGIALSALSRRNEFEADAFASEILGSGAALSEALKKLSVSNLGNLTPHWLAVFLGYSHPPVLQRIAVLEPSS